MTFKLLFFINNKGIRESTADTITSRPGYRKIAAGHVYSIRNILRQQLI